MKSTRILIYITIITLLSFSFENVTFSQTPDTLLVHYSVTQCDSLILANVNNPNFVILDVRSAGEHIPQHLEGAIMRNYYNPNFAAKLDSLPRHKLYLIHCASGGRSGNTFTIMQGLNFPQVVNMLGGMNAWNASSLPTTSSFAPLIMSVSETIIPNEDILIGNLDSISLTLTNRANDTLKFLSISNLDTSEFLTNFDTTTTLLGAQDYTFKIYYEPIDNISDTIDFIIISNGGELTYRITRTGLLPVSISEFSNNYDFLIYPNPANEFINIDLPKEVQNQPHEISIYNINGQQVFSKKILRNVSKFDIADLPNGFYLINISNSYTKLSSQRFIKSN